MTPDSEHHFQTLVQALVQQAHTNPDKLAYRYLTDGETETHRLTYAELHRDARQVAFRLLELAKPGDRALLLYPQGLEFVTALFGCFLAGIIAVPVYPPVGKRRTERLENVAADCTPKLAVTLEAMGREAQQWFAEKGLPNHLKWLYTDTRDNTSQPDGKVKPGNLPEITPETVALLQYTSGSTGDPKGVEVTHDNLVHNNHELLKAVNFNTEVVSWLPIYHDMGLIGNLIFVVYCGGTLTMMSPVDFVRRPVRWLKALSDYKATGTGAPNFAYDLCCRYISDKDLEGIDLSHWDATCNGAEPIRPDTLRQFTERFGKVGFREEVFVPCYGMAEATALVAGNRGAIHHLHLDLAAMQQGKVAIAAANAHEKNVKELACSGPPAAGMRIAIVDPKTLQRCAPDTIGEIWVQGRSVTKGYWNKPELNKIMFEARIQKPDGSPLSEEGKWLRTGDMGFMRNGMVYVSGRLKEMLIINGANIFPQDIERVIQENNPVIEENAGAVFGVEGEGGSEQIIVFQEIARKYVNNFNPAAVITAISQRVLTHSELSVSGVYLISPGRLPKTTSGKIQRYKCAEAYAAKEIPGLLAHWDINELKSKNQNTMPDNSLQPIKSHDAPLFATIAEALLHYSESEGDRVAYRFLIDGETEGATLSFPELSQKGHSIAAEILKVAQPGDRAILLYPPGVEFVEAFVGCLLAGVIAVPMYPPSGNRRLGRLELVAGDCAPVVALSITEVTAQAKAWFSEKEVLRNIQWINTNEVEQTTPPSLPVVNPGDIAFLQYTSGSTGTPKGVEVTHANLVHNAFLISNSTGGIRKTAGWLPIYHDMGLIGHIVFTMYCGGELNFMSPVDFIRKPARWLKAISKYGAQANGSPNFAFDLCTKGISDEEMEGVDLSTWRVSCNGAEPIKPNTIRRFVKRFAKYGLREDVILPCYGMAETTLIVSGRSGEIHNLKIDKDAFLDRRIVPVDQHLPESPRVLEIASSGPVLPDTLVEIVDPETMQQCAPNTIGEVWIQGNSVTKGYWKRPELTEATFRATLRNGEGKPIEEAGHFLRTGDMGFIHNGMLYISGRIKEMIIISGANHYPQDIEQTVQEGISEVQENAGAAFGVEDAEGNERLVVFQEISRQNARDFDADAIFDKIRNKIFASHEVPVSAIYLMGPGQIPKTTSGKIQRVFCKRMFESGEVPGALSVWQSPEFKTQADAPVQQPMPEAPNMAEGQRFASLVSARQKKEVEAKIIEEISSALELSPASIDVTASFARLGISSIQGIQLTDRLSQYLGVKVQPTDLYDYSTISDLSAYITGLSSGPQAEKAVAEVRATEVSDEPVAVIGMSCRLPGADNLDSYWQLLSGGKDAITEVPADRWNLQDFYAEKQEPGKMVTKWGGFLNGVDLFDAPFFEISPREAEVMDPQQRVLLQETYKLLESSGYPAESLRGKDVGVFIGIAGSDYAGMVLNEVADRNIYTATGTSYSIVANRLSYFFDFRGPSVALDTACSSSLVALHLAAQAIRNGECSTAIAGGVNMILAPDGTLSFSESGLMAHDGHCKTFGADANGIVRSDGCGVVLLKPLSQALADGDHIHAVIRGSAVNQDGRSNGLTAPNGLAQQECLRAALRNAHLTPADVDFVECHGTGTILGDPIEVNALNAVYGQDRRSPLVVGSVKANIGHLEAAAGVAGFIKAALALSHRQVPPQIHFESPNPQIDWKNVNVEVAKGGHMYNGDPQVLRAGVSSFGFGGTNAHIILEEAPKATSSKAALPDRGYHVVPVSGKDAKALKQRLADLDRFLEQRPEAVLADLAYTLSTSRDHFKQRAVVFGSDVASVRKGLAAAARGEESLQGFSGIRREGHEKIAFLFTGAGPQYPGMGKYMYDNEPAFRTALDAAVAHANKHLSLDLMKVIFCTPGSAEHDLLDRIDFMQPAVFAYEYAMYKWWESLGVTPDMVIGHSLGELVAACVAGVFDLESAMKLTVKRGDLIYRMPVPGTMASIQGSEAEVIAAIGTRTKVSVGVLNNPMQTVVSGEVEDVEAIVAHFTTMGRKTKVLNISRAGHSPLMDPISDAFREVAASFAMRPASIPVVSNVTGKVAGDEIATAQYWVDHLRQPVRFYDGLNTLDQSGANVLIEVGPNPVLLGISTQAGLPKSAIHIASANEEDPNNNVLYNALAKYYASGGKIDWKAWFAERPAALTTAPNYPFSATRHWIETGKKKSATGAPTGQPLLSQALKVAGLEGVFELEVSWDLIPYLRHHQIIDTLIAPGSFHIELILEYMAYAKKDFTLRELSIQRPLYVDQHMSRRVQLVVEKQELSDSLNVKIFSADNTGGDWMLHVSGTLQRRRKGAAEEAVDLEVLKQEFPRALDVQKFYNDLAEIGFHYGHSFQGVQELYAGNRASMGRVAVQLDGDELVQAPKNQLHPTLLDSAFQLLMAVSDDEGEKETYLPFAVENLNLLLPNLTEYWAVLRARDTAPGAEIMSCDIALYSTEGQYAGALGFTCKKASPEQIVAGGSRLRSDWMFDIRWSDLSANALSEQLPAEMLVVQPGGMAAAYSAFTSGLNERKVAHHTCSSWNEAKTLLDSGSFDAMAVLWDTSAGGQSVADKARDVAYEGLQMLKDIIAMAPGKGGDFIKRIFFVTEGFASGQINPASAPVWGLGRTFAKETNFDVKLLDTDGSSGSISQLHAVMFGAGAENQLRIAGGKTQVLRLEKHRSPGGDPKVPTAQGTYLITGGLGDLGLQAARWMAKNTEVAHLLLWARRAPGDDAKAAIAELEAQGVKITVQSVDVIDAAAVKKAIDSVPAEYPLKGVLHIAGVADDALIPEQSREKFDKVIMPKIQGTWNLHEATKHLDLEVFSLYSSLSAIAGVPGVANYAVGNAFLDTLAAFRRSQGLAAHSINWGAWATSTGLLDASRVEDFRNYMRARGLGLIEGEAGLDILGYTLRSANLDSQTLVAPLLLNSRAPFENAIGDLQPLYQELFAREEEEEGGDEESKESIALRLSRLETHQERKKLLVGELQKQVALVIRRDDPEGIDPDAEFFALGADSLMLAELVNRISKLVRVPLSPTVVFDQRCINDLAEDLLTNTIKWDAASVAGEAGKASTPKPAVKVDAPVVAKVVVEEVPVMENGHLDDWYDVLKANLEREIMKRGKDPKALQEISALRRTVSKLAALLDRKL